MTSAAARARVARDVVRAWWVADATSWLRRHSVLYARRWNRLHPAASGGTIWTPPVVMAISVSQVITRCGCLTTARPGDDATRLEPPHEWQSCHVWTGPNQSDPCPHPLAVEDLGVTSYWHRRRWRRWLHRARALARGRRLGNVTHVWIAREGQ